jgi:hypothetical protein
MRSQLDNPRRSQVANLQGSRRDNLRDNQPRSPLDNLRVDRRLSQQEGLRVSRQANRLRCLQHFVRLGRITQEDHASWHQEVSGLFLYNVTSG